MTSWVISIFLRSTPRLGVLGEERHERSERQRVHDDAHVRLATRRHAIDRTRSRSVASAAARFSSSAAFMLM